MPLIYRLTKGSPLTISELDGNFQYFTGSHAVTGSFITSGSLSVTGSSGISGSNITLRGTTSITGNTTITGNATGTGGTTSLQSTTIAGSSTTISSTNVHISGILTASNSAGTVFPVNLGGTAPGFSGTTNGQFLFGSGSNGYQIFVWINGAWRSGSLS